jgi:hypothetical protein
MECLERLNKAGTVEMLSKAGFSSSALSHCCKQIHPAITLKDVSWSGNGYQNPNALQFFPDSNLKFYHLSGIKID